MNTALAVVFAVLAVSLLIVIHEAGHFLAARRFGMKVERFSIGFGPVILSFRRGETEFAISALPFGGYVKIAGMAAGEDVRPDDATAFSNQAAWRRFLVILAGPGMNYVTAVVIAGAVIATVGLRAPDPSSRVGEVVADKPAARAGLAPGDRVLSVDGVAVSDWDGLVRELRRHPGRAVPLEVERAEGGRARRLTLTITPEDEDGVGKVGLSQHAIPVRRGPVGALAAGFTLTNQQVAKQVTDFGQLFARPKGMRVEGPVGIARQLVRGAQAGTEPFLALVWVISIVLAILNLFPIPALDGGRLVFLGYEMVTRRRVNARVENALHFVGFVALVGLILAVTVFGDLARLRGK